MSRTFKDLKWGKNLKTFNIDRGRTGSTGSTTTIWPPLLTCIIQGFCHIWVTTMHCQRHSITHAHALSTNRKRQRLCVTPPWRAAGLSKMTGTAKQARAVAFRWEWTCVPIRELFMVKSVGQNCTLFGIHNNVQSCSKMIILHITFPKFLRGDPSQKYTLHCRARGHKWPHSSSA